MSFRMTCPGSQHVSILRHVNSVVFFFFATTHCSLLRLIVLSGLNVPTFATRRLHACHHARAPSGGRWNCGREMSGKFCLNIDLHVIFRDLLHAAKIWHGTDGVLRIFRPKNPTASAGCEPANLGTKGQHATSRQPKPLRNSPYYLLLKYLLFLLIHS
jgi:hypothetical protein